MYMESGGGFPVLETQNSTGGFTPANVNQIVSDVNIEQHTQAMRLVTTPGTGHPGTLFARLDDLLTRAIAADQAVFRSDAAAGRDAFAGLEVGVIVLALTMAAGCARGISRRLAECR
jgi:hypothetical protein